jgi:hypothetical protein
MVNGDNTRAIVTWPLLLTVLGLIVPPIGFVAYYGVLRANVALEKATEAIVTANRARPDPFTGTQATIMEAKLTDQMNALESRCTRNAERLDREINRVEKECHAKLHQAQGFFHDR